MAIGDRKRGGKGWYQEAEVKRRPKLDQRKKELMMTILLRNPNAFLAVRDSLKVEHFGEFDHGYKLVWILANGFYDRYQELPDAEFLRAEVESAADANPSVLPSDDDYAQLDEFLAFAFHKRTLKKPPDSEIYTNWAAGICRQFLEERLADQARALLQTGGMLPVDLPAAMADLVGAAERIASAVTSTADDVAFPDGWDRRTSINVFTTGVPYIDEFLGGGHAPGEVYGLMGPYGSAKTTHAAMLAVEGARHFFEEARQGGRRRLSFVFTYEARLAEMRNRTIGYAAKIHRDTTEHMTSAAELSRTGSLKAYERHLFADKIRKGDVVPGEFERAMDARQLLNPHLVLRDLTGHEIKGVGNDGVPEIRRTIEHVCRKRDALCGLVVVDYVGAMVKRYMAAHDIDLGELRHLIGGAPLQFKSQIADVFDCPAWAIHQFSGEANSRNSSYLLHHTDAAEAKNFGENLDFAFCIGVPEEREQVSQFGCTKHRRQPGKERTFIKIDGALHRVLGVGHLYQIGTMSKRIVLRADAEQLPTSSPVRPVGNGRVGGTGSGSASHLSIGD